MRDIKDTKLAVSKIHEVATMLDPATKLWIIKTKGLEYVSKSLLELLCQQQVVQPGVQIKQEPGLPPAEAEAKGVPALPNLPSQPDDSDEDTEVAGNPAKKINKEKEEDCVYDWLSNELTIVKVEKPEQNVTEARYKQDIDLFLDDWGNTKSSSAMVWWSTHSKLYPNLATLAKQYLCIPASSMESERIWSLAGNILTKNGASLKAENLEMLIFVHHNRKKDMSK